MVAQPPPSSAAPVPDSAKLVVTVDPEEAKKAAEKAIKEKAIEKAGLQTAVEVNVKTDPKTAKAPAKTTGEAVQIVVASPSTPAQVVTVKGDNAVKVVPIPAAKADEPIKIVAVPAKAGEPAKVIEIPALKADEPIKVVSLPVKVDEPAKVVTVSAKVDEPLKVVEIPTKKDLSPKVVVELAAPEAAKKSPTAPVAPQPLTPTIVLTKPDSDPASLMVMQNVTAPKAPEQPKSKLQNIPHEAEPIVILEDTRPQARLRWRYRARSRLHRARIWLKNPRHDQPERHERPRKRDRIRAKFFTESSFSFLVGRQQAPMLKPMVVEAAQTPRGPYEHHTTHGMRAMRSNLFTRLHEKRQQKHREAAEMHRGFSIRAKADGFMDVASYHLEQAERHARKEVHNAEKSLRGRKRHVEEEVHAAEKHVADKRRHDQRYLNAQIGHISAQLHHKNIGETEKKKAEDHLRAAKIKLEMQREQLEKEERARRASKKDASTAKQTVPNDLGTAMKNVRLPSAEVEVRVGELNSA